MALFNANTLMRELRKASGLTQEQAAEGICSRETIVKLEKGERKPSWFIFKNVMKKLNVDPTKYYNDIVSEDEIHIYSQLDLSNKLLRTFDYEGLKVLVDEIGQDERFSKGLGYEILLQLKGILYSLKPYFNFDLAFKYLIEHLKIFRPDFEIEKIPDYFLSGNDISVINTLASAYRNAGDNEKSIELFHLILENCERKYRLDADNILPDMYIYTIFNTARALVEEVGRHEEGLQMAEKGMELLKGSDNTVYIRLLCIKAFALMYLGRKQEGEEAFKRCILFTYAMGENTYPDVAASFNNDFFEKKFGYRLDLSSFDCISTTR